MTLSLLVRRTLELPEDELDELGEDLYVIFTGPIHYDEPHLYHLAISARLSTI